MPTRERIHIVGAGLAGLTAAINLARKGFQVVVFEKQPRIGGRTEYRPDPAGSPFNLERLAAYTGIDISPAVRPLKESRYLLWGTSYRIPFPETVTCYMVERGRRPSSLDSLLFEIARREGVQVVFNKKVSGRSDFEALPPRSILATGLEEENFRALGIPHEISYAYCAKGRALFQEATVTVYMGSFTHDYGFSCTVNGIALAFLFQRGRPLTEQDKAVFRTQVEASEPFVLRGWRDFDFGACPSGSLRNPRLFWKDKILAGSLGGSIDPLLNFGMLGAMLSGRIAALAVTDRRAAVREFHRLSLSFYPLFGIRRCVVRVPDPWRARIAKHFLSTQARLPQRLQRLPFVLVPGYGWMG